MTRAELVLASQSPRRSMLLRAAGLSPKVIAPSIDETPLPNEPPIPYALRVARRKAASIGFPGQVVLAADTVVALDAEILAKAADGPEAEAMLSRLSGRIHAVHTAVVARRIEPAVELFDVISTQVRFRRLAREDIARYVQSGDWMDKAGAYGIQGEGGALIADVLGSYTNVVGLPLEETLVLLELLGVE